jgi:autotransporter-associated beta strand protein
MKTNTMIPLFSLLGVLGVITPPGQVQAANRFWNGNGGDNFWTNRFNWGGTNLGAGDDLIFQPNASVNATSLNNTNNYAADFVFGSITFQAGATNYVLNGNRIVFNTSIAPVISSQSGGGNTVNLNVRIDANATFEQTVAGGPLQLNGAVNLNGHNLTNKVTDTSGRMEIAGLISGNGDLVKTGNGTLLLDGGVANTYAGTTRVTDGTLELNDNGAPANAMVPGDVIISAGARLLLTESDQIADTANVTVEGSFSVKVPPDPVSGLFDLGGFNETIGSLTLTNGGDVQTDKGTLTLGGDVSASAGVYLGVVNTAAISGFLSLGNAPRRFNVIRNLPHANPELIISAKITGGASAELTKTGEGAMGLSGANAYAGRTTVRDGWILAAHAKAFGDDAAGTVLHDGSVRLEGVAVANEWLTNSSTSSILEGAGSVSSGWSSNIVLNADLDVNVLTGGTLDLSGAISGAGGITKAAPGTLVFSGSTANSYLGTTWVDDGGLVLDKSVLNGAIAGPGPLVIGDGAGGANADMVQLADVNQIVNTVAVVVNSSGLYDMNGYGDAIGSLAGNGNVNLGAATMNVGFDNTSTVFSGVISGTGGIDKYSGTLGTLTLSGNNLYTGPTLVNGGTLLVNGSQPQSQVTVGSSGTLGGTGTVGHITASGIVAPGTSCGMLTSSNVAFGASGSLSIELCSNASHDQLNARGTVNLTGAALAPLTVTGGFLPKEGDQFIIVNNDASDAVTGTFDSLSEGAVTNDITGNFRFRISYAGGSGGNDVVLVMTNQFLKPGAGLVSSGNGNGGIEPNECNLLSLILSNLSAATMTGLTGTLQSLTPGVVVVQPHSTYPDIPINSRRTNDSLFQITTLPGFACGTSVDLELEVVTTTHGTLKVPFSLPSGVVGSPVRFNNVGNFAIPDSGSVTSAVTVAGIITPIRKVTVSLHITHTTDEDLDVSLEAPDGTTINLTSDNGGTGDDYGTDCVDAQRTVFDDSAVSSIIGQSAPFVGTFRPEQALTAFNGKSGAEVNGTWRLIVADDAAGGLGTLRCWSLMLYGTACPPGSGICELCPDVTLTSALGTTSTQQTGRLVRSGGSPSACGSQKPYPGLNDSIAHSYDAFTFRNGPTDACVTVTLQSPTADVFSAAYTNSFNPANIAANYRADAAFSTQLPIGPKSYGFSVAANQEFVVTVNEVNAGTGGDYTLSVTGGDCRPLLNIRQHAPGVMKVDWTTAAAGYLLERTNVLVGGSSGAWSVVNPNPSRVMDGKFMEYVTNLPPTINSNAFYRLHKP